MDKPRWVVCVLFRETYGEIEYLLVTPKPKGGEPYEHRLPSAPQFTNKSAVETAYWVAGTETGYLAKFIDYRNDIEPSGAGETIQLFAAKALGDGNPRPKVEDLKAQWLPYDEAWHLLSHGLLKEGLDKADLHLRKLLPGPFLRRDTDSAFRPVIKQVMKMCGPVWSRIQEVINDEVALAEKQKRSVGETVINDTSLDLVGIMHKFPLVAALHKYFQRIFVLDNPHRLLILPNGTDMRARVERDHGSDWTSTADAVSESLPLAADALRDLAAKVRASEDRFGLIEPATPDQAAQLKRLMAMYRYSYAMENRLRVFFAMCPNGTVVAHSMLNCPKRYRDAISPATLLSA